MKASEQWTVAEALYEHGLTAYPHSTVDLIIEDGGGDEIIAEVKRLMRAPRSSQIEKTRALHPDRAQLYVVPSITPSIVRLGVQFPFTAFIGMFDNTLVWKAERRSLRQEPLNPGQRGRQPWARWAVMRALLAPVAPMNQVPLAQAVGASQASVSNALAWLDDAVSRTSDGWVAADPVALWDLFLETYPGVGVVRTHWFSLDPPVQQAQRVAEAIAAASPDAQVLYSGDAGADMVTGWRVPTRAAVYSEVAVNPEHLGFAASKNQESTLDFVMPHDPTIWHTAQLFTDKPVADPLIIASELRLNPGVEVTEAIQRLKDQTLGRLCEVLR